MHFVQTPKGIFVPKSQEYEVEPCLSLPLARMRGEVRLVLMDSDGTVRQDTGWFPNLITNGGLVRMGVNGNWASTILIGSSATAPSNSDTSLGGFLASAGVSYDDNQNIPVAPNYEMWVTFKARFNAGVGTGTIREVGFHPSDQTANTNISTHALVSPAVVKGSTQVLDVFYRMYRYPYLTDRTGVVAIEGVNYNYIVRAGYLTDGGAIGSFQFMNPCGQLAVSSSVGANATYTGNIAGVTSGPTGLTGSPYHSTWVKNSNSSGQATFTIGWGLDNSIGNVRSFYLREYGHNSSALRGWQVRIGKVSDDTALTKLNTEELYITFQVTWDRYP